MQSEDFIPLWFRPLRRLLDRGSPVGPITMLWAGEEPGDALPLGCATRTAKDRLVFWPIMPPKAAMVGETLPQPIDHVTLEFPSRKMHITHYGHDSVGHHSDGWRLHEFSGTGLALWFQFFVRWSVLDEQDRIVEQTMVAPPSDADRRKSEFVRFAQRVSGTFIPVPPRHRDGDFLCCMFYVVTDSSAEHAITKEMFPCNGVDEFVDGWPDGVFGVQGAPFQVCESDLFVASACPPGRLKDEVSFGFPAGVPRRATG